jgi:hypothetical protein
MELSEGKTRIEIEGIIIQVLPIKTGESPRGPWKKREFILETLESMPKKICVSLWGDLTSDPLLNEKEIVKVSCDIESREFNNRWYTELRGWNITPIKKAMVPRGLKNFKTMQVKNNDVIQDQQPSDNLPF